MTDALTFAWLHHKCALSPATIFRMNTSEKSARNYLWNEHFQKKPVVGGQYRHVASEPSSGSPPVQLEGVARRGGDMYSVPGHKEKPRHTRLNSGPDSG
jgi:hypothetical protein